MMFNSIIFDVFQGYLVLKKTVEELFGKLSEIMVLEVKS